MISYHMILSYDMILQNLRKTDRQITDREQTENRQRPLLSPVDHRGERANCLEISTSKDHILFYILEKTQLILKNLHFFYICKDL